MATFKILYDTTVILKKERFDKYEKYNKLREDILKKCKEEGGKIKLKLSQKDNFVLKYVKDNNNPNLYFPEALDKGIFSAPTFEYFKEKIALRGIKDLYKFKIEKVERPPKWIRPQFCDILNDTLEKSFQPIINELQKELSLSKLEASQIEYSKMKNQLMEKEKNLKEEHQNVICNNCYEKVKGKRFICSECNNYNLCQNCEKNFFKKQIHNRDHVLIQINKPIDVDNNLLKYNNIIKQNNIVITADITNFKLNFSFINNGTNNLKDCYILPVRYGDEYLSCKPFKFIEDFEINFDKTFELQFQVPDTGKKTYEGYFRMFTPYGLPFGQLITIKVLKGD